MVLKKRVFLCLSIVMTLFHSVQINFITYINLGKMGPKSFLDLCKTVFKLNKVNNQQVFIRAFLLKKTGAHTGQIIVQFQTRKRIRKAQPKLFNTFLLKVLTSVLDLFGHPNLYFYVAVYFLNRTTLLKNKLCSNIM